MKFISILFKNKKINKKIKTIKKSTIKLKQ